MFDPVALGIFFASTCCTTISSKGDVLWGIPSLSADKNTTVQVFHAGTTFAKSNDSDSADNHINNTNSEKEVITDGGRVLCVTALADTILDAQQAALMVTGAISFEGAHYRRDIGHHAISREML